MNAVIYRETVKHYNKNIIYIGSTGKRFKNRYYKDICRVTKTNKKDSTNLSNYIHNMRAKVS